jgi:hypothetical protein
MPARTDATLPPPNVAPAPQLQVAPAPVAAPHSQTAQNSEEDSRNARLRERATALRTAARTVPISDVTIIMGMRTKSGRQEVIHDIGPDHRILKCSHEVVEKVRAVTEEGQFLGYEPTGEYEMTIKVKYLKE